MPAEWRHWAILIHAQLSRDLTAMLDGVNSARVPNGNLIEVDVVDVIDVAEFGARLLLLIGFPTHVTPYVYRHRVSQ